MIVLIYPYDKGSFYINPLLLQKIGNIIDNVLNMQWKIFDVRITSFAEVDSFSNSDIYIIDTEFGFNDWIRCFCRNLSKGTIIFVGNAVDFSNPVRFLISTYKQTGSKCYAFPMQDEYQIINALKYVLNSNLKKPENLIFYDDIVEINNCNVNINSIRCLIKKKNRLKFHQNIYDQYEKGGFQIFLEAFSRGCENFCSYCHLNNLYHVGNGVIQVQSDIHEVIEGLQNKYLPQPVYIQFKDENFFGSSFNRMKQIESFIKKLEEIPFCGYIGIDARLDSIICKESFDKRQSRQQIWKRFATAGLRYCYLGIETFSNQQLIRYQKNLNLNYLFDSLDFLDSVQISYTLGLILWDPKMTIDDIYLNLNIIKSHNLYGKVASLLKEIRLQIDSSYLNRYPETVKMTYHSDDFIHINRDDVFYEDSKIRCMLPSIRYVFDIFNKNGYRHSDVALLEPLYTQEIFKERIIPVLVTKMECEIIEYLLKSECKDNSECKMDCNRIIKKYLIQIFQILDSVERLEMGSYAAKIHNYYTSVFDRINKELSEDSACT